MKLVDTRDNRIMEGDLVATIPAHEPVPEIVMKRFYKLVPGDRNYDILSAPMEIDRVVLARGSDRDTDDGPSTVSYYIVPRYPFYQER